MDVYHRLITITANYEHGNTNRNPNDPLPLVPLVCTALGVSQNHHRE